MPDDSQGDPQQDTEQADNNFITYFLDTWIFPEIERRRQAGELPED